MTDRNEMNFILDSSIILKLSCLFDDIGSANQLWSVKTDKGWTSSSSDVFRPEPQPRSAGRAPDPGA
jgi:hypothetical protein